MSNYSTFEDLIIWQESMQLCVELYKHLEFCKDYGFKDQITRSSVSVPSNIAEGFERNSQKEYSRFLVIAKGSAGETRTQLYLGKELGYIKPSNADDLISKSRILSKKIGAMINAVEKTIKR